MYLTFNNVLLKDITTIDDSDQFCKNDGSRVASWSQLKAADANGDPKNVTFWSGSFKWDDTSHSAVAHIFYGSSIPSLIN